MAIKEKNDPKQPAGGHDLFFGHQTIEKDLVDALTSDRLHHAWLIEGIAGIGKATLAHRMARFLLAEKDQRASQSLSIDPESRVWHLTRALSHPDFIVVSPAPEQKTPTITVNDIRAVNQFFTKSPALGTHRICIIDAVDNMNLNAANALLKLLEEPPAHAIFFLVSHRAGSVLATIRSRCRRLKLKPMKDQDIHQLLKAFLPQISKADLDIATKLGQGSAGRALRFASNTGKKLFQDCQKLIAALPHLDVLAVQSFCAELADDEKYDLFCSLMLDWGYLITTQTEYSKQGIAFWDKINDIIQTSRRFNMDHKLAAQHMFLKLEESFT